LEEGFIMRPIHVVLAHHDPKSAECLARSFDRQFLNFTIATTTEQIRRAIARLKTSVVIVDLELISFPELGELCREFPATAFVCIHRLADDAMWTHSLALGAADCCLAGDLPRILQTSDRYIAIHQQPAIPAA
jgi:hypothetical protein